MSYIYLDREVVDGAAHFQADPPVYTVGAYRPDDNGDPTQQIFEVDSVHLERESAAARVNFLNGGRGHDDGGGPVSVSGARRKNP
jgi:hypothetical protein